MTDKTSVEHLSDCLYDFLLGSMYEYGHDSYGQLKKAHYAESKRDLKQFFKDKDVEVDRSKGEIKIGTNKPLVIKLSR